MVTRMIGFWLPCILAWTSSGLLLAQEPPRINNGIDVGLSDQAAWFLGNGELTWCVRGEQLAPLTRARIEDDVERAFKNWEHYGTSRKVDAAQPGFPKLAFKRQKHATCSGSENLTIAFGIHDAKIDDIRSRYQNPIAFAYREPDSLEQELGRGMIWVENSPEQAAILPWTKTGNFMAIIMHEMGHVYGSGHVPGTIMSENLVTHFKNVSSQISENPDKDGYIVHVKQTLDMVQKERDIIDWSRELYICPTCLVRQELHPNYDLDGFERSGAIRVDLSGENDYGRPSIGDGHEFFLNPGERFGVFAYAKNSPDPNLFPFRLEKLLAQPKGAPAAVFRKVWRGKTAELFSMAESWSGTLTGGNFKKFPILVNRNLGARLEMFYISQEQTIKIFQYNGCIRLFHCVTIRD